MYQNENLSETEALELGSRIYQVLKQDGSLDMSVIVKEGVQKGSWSPVELQEGAILEGASEFAATEITGTELVEAETIAGSIEETLDGVQYYARGLSLIHILGIVWAAGNLRTSGAYPGSRYLSGYDDYGR